MRLSRNRVARVCSGLLSLSGAEALPEHRRGFCVLSHRFFNSHIDTYHNTYYNYPINPREAVKISSDEAVKLVQADGWYPVRQRGSHRQFKHPRKQGKVTIPMGYKDLPAGTRSNILSQAGLK
jgi:predicted RNA binding protein YcfA (HicA-like mRNA interferase family)